MSVFLNHTQAAGLARQFLFAVAALAIFGVMAFSTQPQDYATSDFYAFWAGAQLLGDSLYDPASALEIQRAAAPLIERTAPRYIRPPFYAVMLWPLGRLPSGAAYVVWFALNAAALLAFAWLWRPADALFSCALFFPLWLSFGWGQDAPLMLAILAAGARLMESRRGFAAGLVLSLCAIKPHLLLLVPVALLVGRERRAIAGLLAGGAALYAVSAAVSGILWPLAFIAAAKSNEAFLNQHHIGLLPNRAPLWGLLIATLAGAVLVALSARRMDARQGIAFAAAAGVVVAARTQAYDACLFLPLMLSLRLPPIAIAAAGGAAVVAIPPFHWIAKLIGPVLLALGVRRGRLGE